MKNYMTNTCAHPWAYYTDDVKKLLYNYLEFLGLMALGMFIFHNIVKIIHFYIQFLFNEYINTFN